MSDMSSRVEIITGVARRRRFTTEQKLAVVADTTQLGMSISYAARRHGPSPSLVFRWKPLMAEGGQEAVRADDEVVTAADIHRLGDRVRELERRIRRKTLEVEILKKALDASRSKSDLAVERAAGARLPMKAIIDTFSVARSNVAERVRGLRQRRGPQTRPSDLELATEIRRPVDQRPTYGCRGIATLFRRQSPLAPPIPPGHLAVGVLCA